MKQEILIEVRADKRGGVVCRVVVFGMVMQRLQHGFGEKEHTGFLGVKNKPGDGLRAVCQIIVLFKASQSQRIKSTG